MQLEANRWYKCWSGCEDDVPSSGQETLAACDPDFFPTIHRMVSLFTTIPVTSCEAERTFSTLKNIKTVYRSTIGQERLIDLMLLKIHADLPLDVEAAACMVVRK